MIKRSEAKINFSLSKAMMMRLKMKLQKRDALRCCCHDEASRKENGSLQYTLLIFLWFINIYSHFTCSDVFSSVSHLPHFSFFFFSDQSCIEKYRVIFDCFVRKDRLQVRSWVMTGEGLSFSCWKIRASWNEEKLKGKGREPFAPKIDCMRPVLSSSSLKTFSVYPHSEFGDAFSFHWSFIWHVCFLCVHIFKWMVVW